MRGITVFVAASAAFISIAFLGACSDSPMPSPSSPTPTSPSVPGPLPVFTVSGVAYEHTPAGIQPLAGLPLRVHGYRDLQTPVTVDVVTDAAGRYEVPGLVREYVLVGARPQDSYLSPCSVRLWLWNDDPKNVHVVSRAYLLAAGTPRSMPPLSRLDGYPSVQVLSGFVTERTSDGVRPVAEASVEHLYGDGQSGDPTGFTVTNANGFYVLCGYDDDYGQAVRVRKKGYRTGIQSIGPSWTIDVQLVRE